MPERTESGKGTVEAFEAREGGEGSALPAAWAHDEGSAARTVWVGGIEHSSADEISVCEAFAPAGSIIAANVRTKYNGKNWALVSFETEAGAARAVEMGEKGELLRGEHRGAGAAGEPGEALPWKVKMAEFDMIHSEEGRHMMEVELDEDAIGMKVSKATEKMQLIKQSVGFVHSSSTKLREKHATLTEKHGDEWSQEDSAANMMQSQFRRLAAVKRVAHMRRLRKKHEKLSKLNGSAWSNEDTMASLLQSTFRAKLAKKAVSKATKFLVRARMEFWSSEEIVNLLKKPPKERTEEDLDEMHASFVNIDFVSRLHSKLVQLQCCRYLRTKTIHCGQVVFEQGDVGDTFYIVLSGFVEYTVDKDRGTGVTLHSGIGDCFGEQSLHGDHGGRRDATVTAREDTVVATLERADFLRLNGELTTEVINVLKIPGPRRKPLELKLVRNLFMDTAFFRKIHFSVLQRYCCGLMQLDELRPKGTLMRQGEHGEHFYIIIEGKVDVFIKKDGEATRTHIREMDEGDSFGEKALVSDNPEERIRTATIEAAADNEEPVMLGMLSRDSYIDATQRLERKAIKALATDPEKRTERQTEMLFEFLHDEQFMIDLKLDGMRRQCCGSLVLQRVGASELVFSEGDVGETFHMVVRGQVRVIVGGATVRTLEVGAAFGEVSLLGKTPEERTRTATIIANTDCLLASMTRDDYLRVHDQKELQMWINKFWVLLTTTITDVGITGTVEWEAYRQLHIRIRKTIAPEFNKKQARKIAKEDWQADLNRQNKGGNNMDHEQFSNALFELVDVWCQNAPSMLMYIEFLRMVFLNVSVMTRKKGHLEPKAKFKKVEDISCLEQQLESMRDSYTARYAEDEARAAKDRELLAQHADIGVVSSELYVDSSTGNRWLNAKALTKSALKAGIFEDHTANADVNHDASSTSSEETTQGESAWGRVRNKLRAVRAPHQLFNRPSSAMSSDDDDEETRAGRGNRCFECGARHWSTDADGQNICQECGAYGMQGGGGGSDDDDGEFAGLGRTSSLGRTRSGPSKQQRQRQLQHQLDDLQARLNAGAYSSSAELESAILQLTKVSSGDLDWTGMGEEFTAMLEALEDAHGMKRAAETGTCYVPPPPGRRKWLGKDTHWGSMTGGVDIGSGSAGGAGNSAMFRDESWIPKQVWVQSLNSRCPVQVAKLAKPAKPPADPRKAGRKARRRNRTSPRAKTLSPKRHRYPNEVKRASEAWASLAKQDPSIAVRQGALPKWFKLSSLPEGPRRGLLELQQQLPAPRALRQSDAPLERSRTQLRPMSSYAHACLEFTKGAPSPMLFEEPWHRPVSAASTKPFGRSLEAGSNDPLGVEPIAMTRRMEKWHGRRALVSPGHRGRPRPQSVPA